MKRISKFLGITALVMIIGFSISACDNNGDNGTGSGGNNDNTATGVLIFRISNNSPYQVFGLYISSFMPSILLFEHHINDGFQPILPGTTREVIVSGFPPSEAHTTASGNLQFHLSAHLSNPSTEGTVDPFQHNSSRDGGIGAPSGTVVTINITGPTDRAF